MDFHALGPVLAPPFRRSRSYKVLVSTFAGVMLPANPAKFGFILAALHIVKLYKIDIL